MIWDCFVYVRIVVHLPMFKIKNNMKKYSIPINWSSYTRIEVEAENMQEALQKAFETILFNTR